ncbi:hypothetical protein ACHWQZ_G005321 [Mnemiopsis leidyi]
MVSVGELVKPYSHSQMEITTWLDDFDNAIIALYGEGITDVRKIACISSFIGDEGKTVVNNFSANQKDTYAHLRQALMDHYQQSVNITVERHKFHTMCQDNGEMIESFVTRLRTQASKCNFVIEHEHTCMDTTQDPPRQQHVVNLSLNISDQFIRDRLVCGVNNQQIRTKLLRERNLTLASAVETVKAIETANAHVQKLFNETPVHQIKQNRKNRNTKPQLKCDSSGKGNSSCGRCGGQKHPKAKCPAIKAVCHECNCVGHYKKMCRSKKKVHDIEHSEKCYSNTSHTDDERAFMGSIDCEIAIHCVDWVQETELEGATVQFKIDTGAQANVLPLSLFKKHFESSKYLSKSQVKLTGYGGGNIPVSGEVILNCKINDISVKSKFIVVPLNVKPVLGLHTSRELGLVNTSVSAVRARDDNGELKVSGSHNSSESEIDYHQVNHPQSHHHKGGEGLSQMGEKKSEKSRVIQFRVQNEPNSEMEKCDGTEPYISNPYQLVPVNECKVDHVTNTYRYDELCKKFKDVFCNQEVGCISQPYDIKLSDNAAPAVHAPRKTPFTLTDKVVTELHRMEKLNVLKKVDEATEWVNSMTVTEKPGGQIRICIDPTDLNRAIIREHSPHPSEEEIMTRLSGSTIFSKLDAKDGYWHVPLTERSSYLTTFNTLIGRFRYLRLPFGLKSANEVFQKRMTQIYEKLDGVEVVFDDILVHGSTQEEHDRRLMSALECSRKAGVKLNKSKCKFGLREVTYLGRVISAKGVKPDPDKIRDVLDMPKPTDRTGVQRILGMINFLAKFIPNMSTITQPLRILLVKETEFVWTSQQDKALEEIKRVLTSSPVLAFYNPKKEVQLLCDASQSGLGTCLLQEGKPIAYASRSLTPAQTRYAQIEKELLAIVFGCERFHQYVYGKDIEVHSDHKPLLSIVNKMNIGQAPPRIQRLLLRLLRYSVNLKFIPGKLLNIPDTLSRAFVSRPPSESDVSLHEEAELMVHSFIANLNCTDEFKHKLRVETRDDPVLRYVKQYVKDGWPNSIKDVIEPAKSYHSLRDNLFDVDDILLFGTRIIIPRKLRPELLERIHIGHQGQSRCKSLARKSVYWRHMNDDIDQMVRGCQSCLERRSIPKKEPLVPDSVPDRAWQRISVDILTLKGRKYQLITDYFSKYPEVQMLPVNPTSRNCIEHLQSVCSRFGLPERVRSDGDPLYTSNEFDKFCENYDIEHQLSSAGYSQSNGFIERHIRTIKDLLYKSEDMFLALLQYRNTPVGTDLPSPAKLLFNRDLRTKVPTCSSLLVTESDKKYKEILNKRVDKMKQQYDQHSTPRDDFVSGQLVCYRDNLSDKIWKPGKILTPRSDANGRSYVLLSQAGNQILRNKRLLTADYSRRQLTVIPDHDNHVTPANTNPVIPEGTVNIPSTAPAPPAVLTGNSAPGTSMTTADPVSPARSLPARAPPPPSELRRSARTRTHTPKCRLSCCR